MGEEEDENDYIFLEYKRFRKKIEVQDDYQGLLNAFLEAFEENRYKQFNFFYHDSKNRKIIFQNNQYSNYSYFLEKGVIFVEEISPQNQDEDEEEEQKEYDHIQNGVIDNSSQNKFEDEDNKR